MSSKSKVLEDVENETPSGADADDVRGYDPELFVLPPTPDSKCVVCTLVLRCAQQSKCCGNHYCLPCAERIKREKQPCPTCRRAFRLWDDIAVQRRVQELVVRCPHCEWKGVLQTYEELHRAACKQAPFQCPLCGQTMARYLRAVHQASCPCRQYTCQYCKNHNGIFSEVHRVHEPACPRRRVLCPNQCTVVRNSLRMIQQRELAEHLRECPKRGRVDDLVKLLREKNEELQAKSELAEKLKKDNAALEVKVSDLQDRVAQLRKCQQSNDIPHPDHIHRASISSDSDSNPTNGPPSFFRSVKAKDGRVWMDGEIGPKPYKAMPHSASDYTLSTRHRSRLPSSRRKPLRTGGKKEKLKKEDHSDSDIDISLLPEDLEDILGPLERDDEEVHVAGTPGGKRVVSVKASTGLHMLEPASDSEIAIKNRPRHTDQPSHPQRRPRKFAGKKEEQRGNELAVLPIPHSCLRWTKCSSLPSVMYEGQAIIANNSVYVGGGQCERGNKTDSRCTVFKYSLRTRDWSSLPPLDHHRFTLVSHKGKVYAIGGTVPGKLDCTNLVYVLSNDERQWGHEIRPMETARMQASAVSHSDCIIVAGGKGPQPLSSVEIYIDGRNEWHELSALPHSLFGASSTVLGGQWYLLGGPDQGKAMLSASLDNLVNAGEEKAIGVVVEEDGQMNPWVMLRNANYECSAVVSMGNAVLALGGKGIGSHGDIRGYFPNMRVWHPVFRSLPYVCFSASAVAISKSEVMVIGGCTRMWRCSDVYMGELYDPEQ